MNTYLMGWLDSLPETFTGLLRLRVQGRSMTPTLRPGDEVVVAPIAPEALTPGDWVVVRAGFLHRYLGRRGERVLTKGDGHLGLDPLWDPDAVVGRVVEASRAGRCFYRRTAGETTRQHLLAIWHRGLGATWEGLRRLKAWWLSLLLVALAVGGVWAAVTVDEFYAESTANKIILHWHTASETGNAGFYLLRSTQENGSYTDIAGLIYSEGDLIGASYQHEDANVTPGILYYYKLQDVPSDSTTGDFFGPITATLRVPPTTVTVTPTATLTPTVTVTVTATSTPTPTPTPTPHPQVRYWADATDLQAGECTVVRWVTAQVKAVYLDSRGVIGEGSQTFCPCATEEHILDVIFQDGSGDQFTLTLNVTGSCQAGTPTLTPPPTGTPTLAPDNPPATQIAPPPVETATSTPLKGELPTVTVAPGTPVPTPAAHVTVLPTFTATAAVQTTPTPPAPTLRLTATRLAVEGPLNQPASLTNTAIFGLLFLGIVLGLGFIGSGVWLWRRRQ